MDKKELRSLVERAKQKDEGALYELYQESFSSVYYLALRMMKNTQDAEDITQETFVSVWKSIGTLMEPEAFFGWVNLIAANKCRQALRKKGVRLDTSEMEQVDDLVVADLDENLLPQEALDKDETKRLVLKIIDSLPEAQRMCVLLYYYHNLSIDQIAGVLECSPGTIKSRLSAARTKIRVGIEALENTEGIRLHGAAIGLLPLLKADALMAAQAPLAGGLFEASITGAAAGVTAGADAAGKGIFATIKAWFTNLGTAAKAAVAGGGLATVGVAVGAVIVFTGSGYSTAPIEWQEPTIESLVRELIDRPEGAISQQDLAGITELHIYGDNVIATERPEGLTYSTSSHRQLDGTVTYSFATTFFIGENEYQFGSIESLEDISNFVDLEWLYVNYNSVNSLQGLTLENLIGLYLDHNELTTLEGIEQFTKLEWLSLYRNEVTSLEPLRPLVNLRMLEFHHNPVSDISPVGDLTNLVSFLAYNNGYSDISALANCPNLDYVLINENPVSDLTPLVGLTELKTLMIKDTLVSDTNALVQMTQLERLYIGDTYITDFSFLEKLINIWDLSVSDCNLTNIDFVRFMPQLMFLSALGNNVTDISVLLELEYLQYLDLRYNPVENPEIVEQIPSLETVRLGDSA